MNYTWEVAIKADKSNIKRENLNYKPTRYGSPYMEVAFENINTRQIEEHIIEVNPLYRFQNIFMELFDINLEKYKDTREYFFDIFMQYMIQLDLRQGYSKKEYYYKFILKEILNKFYSNQNIEAIKCFNKEEVYIIFCFVVRLYNCGSSVFLFKQIMRKLYKKSIVYASNDYVDEYLIYIGRKETEKERQKIKFIVGMFLPINFKIHLFWENHFGIIDVDETMKIDEISIF
ncbi:hypothetical protein [[Clostridium] colinum]|uniref:hypothetical protein n=1 Tax=[Clostridium] colinum TaxID=36835 RepID=UPI002025B179|nr:hypothetical protein [[Clostridium] colinum]